MKRFIQTTAFLIAISTIIIFSRDIQNEIIKRYNHCVEQLASRTITNANLTSF